MEQQLTGVVTTLAESIFRILPVTIALAAIFSFLSFFWAGGSEKPWWRKRELMTDASYWFFVPFVTRLVRIGALVYGAAALFDIHGDAQLAAFFENGHGRLSEIPFWAQVILFLVVSDLLLYWSHRIFHGGGLWKYHAIHHSSEDVDWISAARFHPINLFLGTVAVDVLFLLAGISPNALIWLGPFTIFHSCFVHANLNWTLGPLKYVIATPVFHRWHHTSLEDGGDTNFAGTFPIWDILFGTFRMPKGRIPRNFGADDPAIPGTFLAQLTHPFRQ